MGEGCGCGGGMVWRGKGLVCGGCEKGGCVGGGMDVEREGVEREGEMVWYGVGVDASNH